MTTPYLTTRTVAARLRIGPRRLRTLLAAGRIQGAWRTAQWDRSTCLGVPTGYGACCHGHTASPENCQLCHCSRQDGPWLIPADFTLSPRPRGPLPRYRRTP